MKKFEFENIAVFITEKKDGNQRNKENRLKTIKTLPFNDIYIPNQKHTNIVLRYNDDISNQSDGLYTDKKLIPIGVLTADCIPIVLFNNNELAVIHAGWRGLLSGIVENGFSLFKNKKVKAFIGPFIKSCCYEFKLDDIKSLNISERFITISNGKTCLDLNLILLEKLKKLGVDVCYKIDECTKCGTNYFSYRNGDTNRILTFAYIKGDL